MTYEELLADIASKNYRESRTPETPYAALRAVLDMHKPINVGADKELCSRCVDVNTKGELLYEMSPYPCETIKAIEQELA
jgi:hypothetical protein